jgi:pSer/pThr/pTyr-binding forkhead associated (FHA) protein
MIAAAMADTRHLHGESPTELQARLQAERAGHAFLIYRDGDGAQQLFTLTGERVALSLGRDPASDIAMEWDGEVSRLHAKLERVGGEWTITDDGLSSNGTFVNTKRVTSRRRLRDGDVLLCGATRISFRSSGHSRALEETRRPVGTHAIPDLTPAQRRVLTALCRPFKDGSRHAVPATNQQIADELVVSVDAVKTNLRALYDKFQVEDLPQNLKRARLVELAFTTGIVAARDL